MSATFDLCAIPAGVSPDGIYNFVDPPTLGPVVLAVGVVLAVISTTFTVGRLFVSRNKLHSADYFTFIGCLTNIAYTGVILAQHRYYRHQWDTPVCWYNGVYLRLPFVQTMLFCPAFFFPKAAIFLLYRQLFAIEKRMRIMVDIGLVITLLVYLSEIPLAAIYAAPRAGQSWDSLLLTLEANSHPFALGGSVQSAVGAALDFYIFCLPLPILVHLRMPPRRRWQLIGVFSTALLGVAASIVSLVIKIQILSSTDSSWLAAIASLCSLVETNIALIVGCMPAFAQLVTLNIGGSAFFKSVRSRLLPSSRRGGDASSKGESNERAPRTFGSNQTPRRKNYYELTDTALLETQATVQGHASEPDQLSKPGSTHSTMEQIV